MALYLGNQKVSLRSGQDPTFDYGFDSNGRLVFANKNATEINNFLNYDSSYSEILDLSNLSKMEKVSVNGTADRKIEGLKGLLVSPNAPFTGSSPQINVSYTGLSKSALVSLFESAPYNVGYTKVGNPTIVDGVASNFSADNFIRPTNTLPLANANIDIEIAINANTIFNNAQQRLLGCGGIYIRCLGSAPSWNIYFGEDASAVSMGSVSTYPYIKILRTSGIWYCYRSSDGSSYEQVGTPTAGAALSNDIVHIGGGSSLYWAGSINLNNFYIKVNGVPWFGPGVTKNLVPAGTVVGDVIVKDGVASGFSGRNYLQAQQLPTDFWTNDFEICVALNTPASWPSGDSYLLKGSRRRVGDTNSDTGILVWWSNNELAMTGSYSNISGSSPFGVGITPQLNTKYWMKIVQVGHTISGYYSLNGTDWTLLDTANNYGYAGTPNKRATLLGQDDDCAGFSIDLNNTYIKVGSDYFYRGMVPMTKTCSIVGATGTADLTQEDKNIILNKGWSLTVQ